MRSSSETDCRTSLRSRTAEVQDRPAGGNIRQGNSAVLGQMPAHPIRIAHAERRSAYHDEFLGREMEQRHLGLDAAALVEHGRVDAAPRLASDAVRADRVEEGRGARPFDDKFGKRRLVDQRDALANLPVLLGDLIEPARLVLETRYLLQVCTLIGKAKRALEAEARAEDGARRLEMLMHRRAPQTAASFVFRARPMDRVIIAIGLDGPFLEIPARAVRGAEPAHVEGPEVHAWIAVEDPIGHRFAGAARGGYAGGESARHEEIVELGRETQDRFAVGRDRNRPVDDRLNADLVEDGQSLRAWQREQFEALHVLGE